MKIKLSFFLCFILILAVACSQESAENTPSAEQPTTIAEANTPVPEQPTEAPDTTDTTETGGLFQGTDTPTPPPTETPTSTPVPTETPTPTPLPTVPAEVLIEIDGVTLPTGFSLIKYADLNRPTALMFDDQGRLFVTNQEGEIIVLADEDGDGRAERRSQFSWGFDIPVGIAQHPSDGSYYVSSTGKISVLRDTDGDWVADEATNYVNGLPTGRHKNNNLKFGPDGWLYMGVGSTCDVCYEVDERSATVMRFNTDTGASEVFASGLRNAYDIAFHPETGALFATENGRDDFGSEDPLEELNHIIQGADYGFPDCWNRLEGPGCDGTTQAVAFFEARSSTNSIDFYTGSGFPIEYQNSMFAAVWGSFEADVDRGIWRVSLTPDGESYSSDLEWFADWPNSWLLGLITGPDGALYVGDYTNGGIWRISYGLPQN